MNQYTSMVEVVLMASQHVRNMRNVPCSRHDYSEVSPYTFSMPAVICHRF